MKWFISKRLTATLLTISLLALSKLMAQENVVRDTVFILKHDTVFISDASRMVYTEIPRTSQYDQRAHRYRRKWLNLIPTHTKLQFAGNMGLLSVGVGWDYGKRNQWETDLLFGYLPKYGSSESKMTFTLKQNFIPWSHQVKETPFSFEPLTCGLYFNTVFGEEFWVSEPDRYPKGYYGFSSKIRIHVFMGQRLTYDISARKRSFAKQLTLFYEVSTCDLYLISAITNKYLKPRDYLCLSFGVKMQML